MKFSKSTLLAFCCTFAFIVAGCGGGTGESGSTGDSGKVVIQNQGSDTIVNLAQAWAEKYAEVSPNVSVEVSGGGSGTGIAALINGTVDIANCSRQMKPEEIERVKQNTGMAAVEYIVGYDALAVYVHAENPLNEISIEQLADIYGEGGMTEKWLQLGIKNTKCAKDEIVRVSRQSNSGTYHYFRETLLGTNHDFKLGSVDLHGSKDVVELVEKTPCAIGYSGMGYATEHVKMVKISKTTGGEAYAPTLENALNKTYPIARPLYMYSLGKPKGEAKAYIDWVLSDEGQHIVKENGYVPLQKASGSASNGASGE